MIKKNDVPINQRYTLSISEASAYTGIGTKKIYELIQQPHCNFFVCVGKKRLIIRENFEKYLQTHQFIL